MIIDIHTKTSHTNEINVLTIDDHPIFRQGIHHLLEGEDEINPIAEVASIDKALEWLNKHKTDVILLDHNLIGINGVDAIPQLLETQTDLQIIMLTVSDDNDIFLKAIRNGACGYVLKDTSPDHIIGAIKVAKSGECRVSDSLVRCLFDRVSKKNSINDTPQSDGGFLHNNVQQNSISPNDITERDKEVLKQLIKGLSNKEIAKVLQISPNTVRNRLQKLQDIFNARNRVQLALLAYDAGIGGIR